MEFTKESLPFWSFAWLLVLEVFASIAFLLGGVPVLQWLLPAGSPAVVWSLVSIVLTLCWLASGVAAGFLLYLWFKGGKQVFAGAAQVDTVAFWILVLTGLNTGVAGLGVNPFLALFRSYAFLVLAAVLMLASAAYLFYRWRESGYVLFGGLRSAA